MTTVHITTEVKGGAGEFAKNIHLTMMELGMPSLILTRDSDEIENLESIKKFNLASTYFRIFLQKFRSKYIDESFAIFGIEKTPASIKDIKNALDKNYPTTFVVYWVSYFLSFNTIIEIKKSYPDSEIILVCLDEAFLTGGCHYTNGCNGYQKQCRSCPATSSKNLQQKISQNLKAKQRNLDECHQWKLKTHYGGLKKGLRA